jgi:hypothetical protein
VLKTSHPVTTIGVFDSQDAVFNFRFNSFREIISSMHLKSFHSAVEMKNNVYVGGEINTMESSRDSFFCGHFSGSMKTISNVTASGDGQ